MGKATNRNLLLLLVLSIVSVLFLIAVSENTSAQSIIESSYIFRIEKNKVLVSGTFIMNESRMVDVIVDLPNDASDAELIIDNVSRKIIYTDETEKKLRIRNIAQEIELSYSTRNLIKSSAFFVTIKPFYQTEQMKVEAILPEGYTLETPIKQENIETGSIYPMPNEIGSDGQSLVFKWYLKNMSENDTFSILIILKRKFPTIAVIIALSVVIAGLSVYFYFHFKKKPQVIIKKVEDIEEHLKEDEEQIVNIIKQRGGSCEQGTLRVIMGLPKSSLSRLIKELEDRKVIIKHKKGKKNIILLKK